MPKILSLPVDLPINMNPEMLILHLEDSPSDAELIRERMADEGLNVRVDRAANAREFETFLKNSNYNLILADYHVPGLDGPASLQRAAALRPGTPYICLSGAIGEDCAVELLRQGATDYVSKDRLARLPLAIRRALAEAREHQAHLQAEAELRESEARYQRITESLTDYQYTVRVEDGRAVGTSQSEACVTVTGYTAAEFAADPYLWFRMVAPEHRELIRQSVEEILAGKVIPPFEHSLLRKDGSERWVSHIVIPHRDTSGKLLAYDGVIKDITERKQAETELLRSKAELKAIYDHAPIIMCLLDEERRVVRANRMGIQMANREAHDACGLRGGELLGCINSQDDPRGCGYGPECKMCPLRQMVQDTISTGREHIGEEIQLPLTRGRTARNLCVIIYTARLEIEGQTRVLLCVEDITERKHLEEQFRQAKKMDAIGQLAGGVAHDFNNIIAATMMHLGLLRTNPSLDKDTQNDLKELEVQSNRAATLTRQLLAFGRRSMLDVKVQDMNEIVTNLLKMLRRLIGEDIDVQFNGKGGLPRVSVDTGMMEQVVMNLAVNARDAMPKGGQITIVTQTVEVTAADLVTHLDWKPGRFVCLSVADTGCGMDEETLKRIFEPFFTTKEVGKGTGLGLATVHGIVAQHQGWVDVESLVGQGTTFRIFIPAVQSKTLETDATQLPQPIPGGNETLLLVEDEQTLRRVASLRLRQLGYRVLEVRNGPEALVQWETNASQIDLLFTDMVMPGGMSGLDLAEQLRKIKPELKVIISSGYSSSLAQLGVRNKAGMVFLPKPYNSEDLAQTVRNCLDGKGCR